VTFWLMIAAASSVATERIKHQTEHRGGCGASIITTFNTRIQNIYAHAACKCHGVQHLVPTFRCKFEIDSLFPPERDELAQIKSRIPTCTKINNGARATGKRLFFYAAAQIWVFYAKGGCSNLLRLGILTHSHSRTGGKISKSTARVSEKGEPIN
jgi:hypothetical protein